MSSKNYISILDRASFRIEEIQAVTVGDRILRIYLKHRDVPFEFELPDANDAAIAYAELTKRNL